VLSTLSADVAINKIPDCVKQAALPFVEIKDFLRRKHLQADLCGTN
jgi:hypothetical protein